VAGSIDISRLLKCKKAAGTTSLQIIPIAMAHFVFMGSALVAPGRPEATVVFIKDRI
jgi:hypothetical protein